MIPHTFWLCHTKGHYLALNLEKQSSTDRCLKSLDKYPLLLMIDLCRRSLCLEITIVCKRHSDLYLKKWTVFVSYLYMSSSKWSIGHLESEACMHLNSIDADFLGWLFRTVEYDSNQLKSLWFYRLYEEALYEQGPVLKQRNLTMIAMLAVMILL